MPPEYLILPLQISTTKAELNRLRFGLSFLVGIFIREDKLIQIALQRHKDILKGKT